jgi:predicted nucleic acid-binding protein
MTVPKRWKVFLDTSALLAGVISRTGAAHEVLLLGEQGLISLLVSTQVLMEADRNILKKFPHLGFDFRLLMRSLSPQLVENPTVKEVQTAVPWVGADDAPILACALRAHADYLVTWNTRHFMGPRVPAHLPLKIVTPGTLVSDWNMFLDQWPS